MAVKSSPSQKPLEDALRMGQSMNTSTLSMSTPSKNIIIIQSLGENIILGEGNEKN